MRYYQVVSTAFTLAIHKTNVLTIELLKTDSGEFIAAEAVDAAFAILARNALRLTATSFSTISVELIRPEPSRRLDYESYFNCTVTFNAHRNAISFPLNILEAETPNANEMLSSYLEQYLSEVLKNVNERGFSRQAYSELIDMLPSGAPTLNDLASRMNMCGRTLQRKLNAENVMFKDVLRQLRIDLAKRYLKEQRHKITDISYLLGFSAPGNFVRFFKKQLGCTPTEYIKQ